MTESQKKDLLKCPINEDNAPGNIKPLPKTYKKLIVYHLLKYYKVIDVSEKCFNESLNIEELNLLTCFKIKDDAHLSFMIEELNKKSYKEFK